jgi:hypothetical protein
MGVTLDAHATGQGLRLSEVTEREPGVHFERGPELFDGASVP